MKNTNNHFEINIWDRIIKLGQPQGRATNLNGPKYIDKRIRSANKTHFLMVKNKVILVNNITISMREVRHPWG
jgi:hypothetical protein